MALASKAGWVNSPQGFESPILRHQLLTRPRPVLPTDARCHRSSTHDGPVDLLGGYDGAVRLRAGRSHGDGDLAADLSLLQQPHSVGGALQRVAAVHPGSEPAGLDEAGGPLVVVGSLR